MTHECDPHINYIHKLRTFNRLIFLASALILRYKISAGYDEDELIRIRVQTLPVFACMKLIDCWSAIDISARICRNEIKWWKIQPAPRQTEFHDSYATNLKRSTINSSQTIRYSCDLQQFHYKSHRRKRCEPSNAKPRFTISTPKTETEIPFYIACIKILLFESVDQRMLIVRYMQK